MFEWLRGSSLKMDNPTITKERRVINKFMVFGDRVHEIHTVVVHRFRMGDVEDPDLYAAEPLMNWQNTEAGQWIMEHAVETPCWYRIPDSMQYGYRFQVRAKLSGPRLTEYLLRHK